MTRSNIAIQEPINTIVLADLVRVSTPIKTPAFEIHKREDGTWVRSPEINKIEWSD